MNKGYEKLWLWFGLSRSSWLTIPRSMMHEMPDEWQNKMADLLEEWDETWNNDAIDYYVSSTIVNVKKDNKFIKSPSWLINYRHPDKKFFNKLKLNKMENNYPESKEELQNSSLNRIKEDIIQSWKKGASKAEIEKRYGVTITVFDSTNISESLETGNFLFEFVLLG